MRTLVKCFVVLVVFSLPIFGQIVDGSKTEPKFDPQSNVQQNLDNAVKMAKESGKRIILDVGGEWCIWCHRIDDFINSHADIHNFLYNNYVVVKVNYSPENKNEEFLSKYPKIEGYPHIFVLDTDGKLLKSKNTGELEHEKSYSAEKMMAFFREFAAKGQGKSY